MRGQLNKYCGNKMKATITIQGQISGNFLLKNKIQGTSSYVKSINNGFLIEFKTKKEAYKALWEAFKSLRSDSETKTSTSYCKKYSLSYDASYARINN